MVREKRTRPVSDRRAGADILLKALIDAEKEARQEKDAEQLSPGLQAQTCYWVAGSLVCAGGSVCFQVGNAWICQ